MDQLYTNSDIKNQNTCKITVSLLKVHFFLERLANFSKMIWLLQNSGRCQPRQRARTRVADPTSSSRSASSSSLVPFSASFSDSAWSLSFGQLWMKKWQWHDWQRQFLWQSWAEQSQNYELYTSWYDNIVELAITYRNIRKVELLESTLKFKNYYFLIREHALLSDVWLSNASSTSRESRKSRPRRRRERWVPG